MTVRVVSIISRMNVGGPAVLLNELVTNLPAGEIEHILITGRCLPNEVDYLMTHNSNIRVVYVDELKRSIFFSRDIRAFLKLCVLLRNFKPDVVHTHTSKAGILGRLAAIMTLNRTKIIHTYHGHLLYGYFSKLTLQIFLYLERLLSKKTDVLIAVSEKVRNDLLASGVGSISKWMVIRPGVKFPTHLNKIDAREKFKISKSEFVITWIGRFADIKNPVAFVQAVRFLQSLSLPSFRVLMVGDGDLFKVCQALAAQEGIGIIFTGWLPDVQQVLAASDLLVMSSKNEGMPVVIVEAGLHSVPTLSTNVGGVGEFIVDGYSGFLVDNADDIGNKISNILRDPDIMQTVGKEAMIVAKRDFSVEQYVAAHVQLYLDKKSRT